MSWLVGLLEKLLEFSELQRLLLSPQGGRLVQLVWSHAGLQALQLGRTSASAAAEAQLGRLLATRFMRGGDEMRRTFTRAALGALSAMHQPGQAGPVAAAVVGAAAGGPTLAGASLLQASQLPPIAAQRLHQALLQLVLKVRGGLSCC